MPGLHVPLEEGGALRSVVAVAAREVPDVVVVVVVVVVSVVRDGGVVVGHRARAFLLQRRCLRTQPLSRVIGSVAHNLFVVPSAVVAFGAYVVLRLEVVVPLLHNGRREKAEVAHIF